MSLRQSWFGLSLDAAESNVTWSGGGAGQLFHFKFDGDRLEAVKPANKTEPTADELFEGKSFKSGLRRHPATGELYSLDINAGGVTAPRR